MTSKLVSNYLFPFTSCFDDCWLNGINALRLSALVEPSKETSQIIMIVWYLFFRPTLLFNNIPFLTISRGPRLKEKNRNHKKVCRFCFHYLVPTSYSNVLVPVPTLFVWKISFCNWWITCFGALGEIYWFTCHLISKLSYSQLTESIQRRSAMIFLTNATKTTY